jgi:hypothetical protein
VKADLQGREVDENSHPVVVDVRLMEMEMEMVFVK